MKDINGNQIGFDFTQPPRPAAATPPYQGGDLTNEEMGILEILRDHRGKENAILGPVIETITKIEYDRVRAVISHLINQHGCLIASSSKGYFTPVTEKEILDTTRSLRHRALCILFRASRLMKSSIEDVFGQSILEFKDEIK